jgi:hypothetical protein
MRRFTRNPVCGTSSKPQHLVVPRGRRHSILWSSPNRTFVSPYAVPHPGGEVTDFVTSVTFASGGPRVDRRSRPDPVQGARRRAQDEAEMTDMCRYISGAVQASTTQPRLPTNRHPYGGPGAWRGTPPACEAGRTARCHHGPTWPRWVWEGPLASQPGEPRRGVMEPTDQMCTARPQSHHSGKGSVRHDSGHASRSQLVQRL